ncbi:Oidioi.mRNA.OKI2018_I69.chr1.g361.t1.cds [Oikopleura dioica]|uniref:Oidioi.mRNA.OKI2018_I69.chr1.g361.t1.cds n=1 Tax=Oikopleura dioica TaxID=34765 RepID=A0ABN7STW2_OIKDI|nr:Oidioi.mRNA.OKI2018_I69.chr1.g361.t1.cds [Oikopleura dioica]
MGLPPWLANNDPLSPPSNVASNSSTSTSGLERLNLLSGASSQRKRRPFDHLGLVEIPTKRFDGFPLICNRYQNKDNKCASPGSVNNPAIERPHLHAKRKVLHPLNNSVPTTKIPTKSDVSDYKSNETPIEVVDSNANIAGAEVICEISLPAVNSASSMQNSIDSPLEHDRKSIENPLNEVNSSSIDSVTAVNTTILETQSLPAPEQVQLESQSLTVPSSTSEGFVEVSETSPTVSPADPEMVASENVACSPYQVLPVTLPLM